MLKRLTLFAVIVVFASIGYDYLKNNFDLYGIIDGTVTKIEDKALEQMAPVTTEPSNSTIMPIDNLNTNEPEGIVSTVEELTEAVYYYASQYKTNFTIEFKGDTSNLESMIQQVYDSIEVQDPYLYGHLSDRNIEYSYTSRRATLNFNQQYLTTYEQERYVNGKVQAILQQVNTTTMSDYDKVKFVNDYIVQHTVYSDVANASPHSAYAILFEGKGVCQGYALLAYKMLTELGLEAMYITGEVYTGGHAWNLVKVDGQWYHLDTTWNDPLPDRGLGVRYDYFLMNDMSMQKDHTWDIAKYPRATAANYK